MNLGKVDKLVLAFQAFIIPCCLFGIEGFGLGLSFAVTGGLVVWSFLVNLNIKITLAGQKDRQSLGELLEFCYLYQNEWMGLTGVKERVSYLMFIPIMLGVIVGGNWFLILACVSAMYLLLSDKTEQLTYDLIMENIE